MTLLPIKISQKYEVAGEKTPWYTGTCIVSWHDLYPNRRKNIFIKTSTFCSYWHIWYKLLSHTKELWNDIVSHANKFISETATVLQRSQLELPISILQINTFRSGVDTLSSFFIFYSYCNLSKNISYFGNHLIMHTLNFISLIKETNERELHWKFSPRLILTHLKSRFIGSKLNLLAQVWKELLS